MAIRIAVFGSGAVLMALEMLALRLVAMNFGSALRETSIVIAVFLVAMSLGYYLGGRMGDRWPHRMTLAGVMLGAGLLIEPIPLLNEYVAARIAQSSVPAHLHALSVCVALYLLPVVLMAGVSPIAIRLLAKDVRRSGAVAGNISALSTAGSIIGTIGTSYYLIDLFKSYNKTVYVLGLVMGVLAALVWFNHVRRRPRKHVAFLGLLLVILAAACRADTIVFQRDSIYHHILVSDDHTYRTLRFDNKNESRMLRSDPMDGGLDYTYYCHIPFCLDRRITNVMVIGLGGGTLPKRYVHDYPAVVVDAVEIDRVVCDVAQKFFDVRPGPRLRLHVQDGRAFVMRATNVYDLIVIDAYTVNRYGSTIPAHLTTREFFRQARQRLSAHGWLAYNCAQAPHRPMTAALVKTMATCFTQLFVFKSAHGENTIIVASVAALPFHTPDQLVALASQALRDGAVRLPTMVSRAGDLCTNTFDTARAVLLTDDYAPVDTLMR